MLVLTTLVTDGPGDTMVLRPLGDVPAPALAMFTAASVSLYWRRRHPLAVLTSAVVAWAMTLGSGYADLGGITIVALYSAGRYTDRDWWGELGVVGAIAVIMVDGLTSPDPWGEAAFGGVVMFVAWYVGRRLRLRQERADQVRREQAAEAHRIVAEERTRIARELHDVVAHRVSLMTVQAAAAKTVATDDLPAALEAMGAVEEAGRQALDELRHLLGVLRPESEPDGLGPQPGLAELPRLVAEVAGAGLDVSLETDGDLPVQLPARVDLFLYRIVQEALTNVVKHAGPGTRTRVRLTTALEPGTGPAQHTAGIAVEVIDHGRRGGGAIESAAVGGHGIIGMRERALLLGGSLETGPVPDGGFRVVARLPIAGESA